MRIRDINLPCIKCGGKRIRAPKGGIYCQGCVARYRKDNKERNLIRDRAYHQRHKERNNARNRNYREINKEKIEKFTKGPKRKEWFKAWKKLSTEGCRHPEYAIWIKMKDRCYNKKSKKYPIYGGRGITICDRWINSFPNFIEDMGERPEPRQLYSIDRIDVDGDYEPNNCKWSTPKEQANNTRRNLTYKESISDDRPIYLEYGKLGTLKEFSDLHGIPLKVVKYRYSKYPVNEDFILSSDIDQRYYEYKNKSYNIHELGLISGIHVSTLNFRINKLNWDITKAIETPPQKRIERG